MNIKMNGRENIGEQVMASKRGINYCSYPRCKDQSDVIWLEVGVCPKHFKKICDMTLEKAYSVMQIPVKKIKENSEPCGCKN